MTRTETIPHAPVSSDHRREHPSRTTRRPVPGSMYVGLLLTVVATIAPYVDRATAKVLAHHIRQGYPTSTAAHIDAAVTAWLVILAVVGGLGIAGWIWTIRAVRTGRRWAPWAATGMWTLGTSLALTALLVPDTSGDVGLAPQLGVLGVLPCVAGLVAVTTLWRRSR